MGKEGVYIFYPSRTENSIIEYQDKFRLKLLPAHSGHHLNPMEGFWRTMKDAVGAGRCLSDLQQLYQRTRQVLMAQQEHPIYEFHWRPFPPYTLRVLLFVRELRHESGGHRRFHEVA